MAEHLAIELKQISCDFIDKKASELNDISQQLWKNPELSGNERFAHHLLTTYLERQGFQVDLRTPLETSFVARYGDPSGLHIGVLCEYDALPGIGHACGHNLIAEAGVAAALGIKAAISVQNLKAHLTVFGTPDEEDTGGKIKMIYQHVFDDMDFCLMSHPAPFEIPDPVILSIYSLRIVFHGRASPVDYASEDGINAVDAAVLCYNNISMLRQQMKPSCRIHGVILDGGKQASMIPACSTIHLLVRAPTDEEKHSLVGKVKDLARGGAAQTGCSVDFIPDADDFSAMKTNKTLINLYVENAKSLGVVFNDDDKIDKMLASTDMGNVSQIKPSIHPWFKIKTDAANHTHGFTHATGHLDNQLPTLNSAKSMAMTAIDLISRPDMMLNVREDFKR